MKLCFLLLVIPLLHVSAITQGQMVTLKKKDATLTAIFKDIKRQTGYDFLYVNDLLTGAKKVTIDVSNVTLKEALDKCFKDQPLTYTINNRFIKIEKKETSFLEKQLNRFGTIDTRGIIVDENNNPLVGATILAKGTARSTQSNERGEFFLKGIDEKRILVISYLGHETKEIPVMENIGIVKLNPTSSDLKEIEVVSTGYQSIPKERATGSFTHVDNKLLNRRVSTNILDRLDGITSGLIFNKNNRDINASAITIRGISTIYANREPLIVIDNFPYNGNLSSINPNDVESITILKDAAAASIWGAFSGNGVIVITTKKGKLNEGPTLEINSNITIGAQPDLYYAPQLNSANYISVEQFLFKNGHYNSLLTSSSFPVVSPVVDILDKRANNMISPADSANMIGTYIGQDLRADVAKYLYRKSVNQQHNFNISGGGNNNIYYFSAGYDRNLSNIKRNEFDRITLNGSNTYSFLNKKLELSNVIYFTKSITDNNGLSSSVSSYPYLKLKDENGDPAVLPNQYRQKFIDAASANENLLDWHYRPLDELNFNNNTTTLNEFRINTNLKYQVITGLSISLQHQYNHGNSNGKNLFSSDSFYVRNYINQFTQFDPATNTYKRPVPLGGIVDRSDQTSTSQNARGQINFDHEWNSLNRLSVLAGFEVRDVSTDFNSNRLYGYSDLGSSNNIDYQTNYTLSPSSNLQTIVPNISQLSTTNRYRSYFSNLAYTFKDRYIISASVRKDESNIFGVRTNQKGVPLWSAGLSWELNKERFYKVNWLPYLRLRLTNGYQGNVDNTLSSLVTAVVNAGAANPFFQPVSILSNPPNADLRWEKVNTTNFGLDFSLRKGLSGSIEYYIKKGTDIIGSSPVDPTTGVAIFKGNSADITGKGWDFTLNSANLNGLIKWNSTFLFSYTKDKVKKYFLQPTAIGSSLYGINPIVGNPLYSVYGFIWGGLDTKGDPQVYLDGKLSKDYGAIYNSTDLSNLEYKGTLNPTVFGSLRNNFSWNQVTLSINITYKLGYSFRRPSIAYSTLFGGNKNMPNSDYQNRWQIPGDENKTNVPAMAYPGNSLRDLVYQNSNILIDKGDHVRIQDISLSYNISKNQFSKLPFKAVKVYLYINNIGILWKANKQGIDPDNIPYGGPIYPNPITYALGLKVNF